MLKWILILIAVVIVLGYFRSKQAKQGNELHNENFGSCESGCTGCANRGLCLENKNEEKK